MRRDEMFSGAKVEFDKQLLKMCGLEDVDGIQELTITSGMGPCPIVSIVRYIDFKSDKLETKTFKVHLEEIIKEESNVQE